MKYEATADVIGGSLRMHDRQAFVTAFARWPDGPVLATFETANVFRSVAQNRLWHGSIVRPLADACRVSPRAMHEALKVLLLPERVVIPNTPDRTSGHDLTIGGSTSHLTRNEASNLIDRGFLALVAAGLDVPDRPLTHFIPWDSPPIGRQQRALCGALVRGDVHSLQPRCDACVARLAETGP